MGAGVMSRLARTLVLGTLVLGSVLLPNASASSAPCAASANATYLQAIGAIGQRIYSEELSSGPTQVAVKFAITNPAVVAAARTRSPVAARAAVLVLLRAHLHIVRARIIATGGRVLSDVGGPYVLAPITQPLLDRGQRVGTVILSVQDDLGYVLLAQRFLGAEAVLRVGAQQVMGPTSVKGRNLPGNGTISLAGRTVDVISFAAHAFPSGALRISLLVAPAGAADRQLSCAGVTESTLLGVATRAYRETLHGFDTLIARHLVSGSAALQSAIVRHDPAAATAALRPLLSPHLVRLEVLVHGRPLANVGTGSAIGTVTIPLDGGAAVAKASVLSDSNFLALEDHLTGGVIVLAQGIHEIAGVPPGLPFPPVTRTQLIAGNTVTSLPAVGFADRALRLYLYLPAASVTTGPTGPSGPSGPTGPTSATGPT
jgi:hypothetical protein